MRILPASLESETGKEIARVEQLVAVSPGTPFHDTGSDVKFQHSLAHDACKRSRDQGKISSTSGEVSSLNVQASDGAQSGDKA
jgi:hypothetical protein